MMNRNETAGQVVTVPVAEYLNESFEIIETAPRLDAIAHAKEVLTTEFKKIEEWLITQVNEVSGWDVSIKLTSITDGVVQALARRMFKGDDVPAGIWKEIGVFAIGGYGRGELNPSSDLDVMVVFTGSKMPSWLQHAYNEFHTILWDAGFKVGIALRGFNELEHIIKDDFVTATAILEHRILLGTGNIDQEMIDLLERFRNRRSKVFLKYKIEELMERRNKVGASLFMMEPDLKTNPGCLRDVQLLYNIAFIIFGGRNLYALRELSAVKIEDIKALFQANAHLLRMRSLQHFHHGIRQDVLELRDQVRIAEQLGYAAYSRLSAVEVMMREHYHMILHVHKMVELLISHLHMRGHLGKKISLMRTRKVISKNFTAIAGLIYGTNKRMWMEEDIASQVMEMFWESQRRNMRVSLELQKHIQTNLQLLFEDHVSRENPRLNKAFMSILGDLGRIQVTLEQMHNCGFLGAYMPEFENISSLMQFNSYHQYTVDQHTLFALGNLDAVQRDRNRGLPKMQEIMRRIKRKDLLALGLLLHDVGKYMGRGHVMRGALMVGPVARRMHLTPDEEDIVYFLVEQHVSLSDASRMRDISDPEFIEKFAAIMGTQLRLDMLYCLTYADAKATSDKVLTGWQMSVLYELYENLSAELSTKENPVNVLRRDKIRNVLLDKGVVNEEISLFLDNLPYQYSYNTDPQDAVAHYDLYKMATHGQLGFRKMVQDGAAIVDVAMPWKTTLFGDVTGVFSAVGCQIIDARCWSITSKVSIYRFQLEHGIANKFDDEGWWSRLVGHLNHVNEGICDVGKLIAARRKNIIYEERPADSGFNDPAVKVEQKTSKKYSILDVHHKDEPGSLSIIANVITRSGYDVDYATVSIMGDVATGVFYVADNGVKLSDEAASELQSAIAKELNVI